MVYHITGSEFNWNDMFQSIGNPQYNDNIVYCFYDSHESPLYVGKSNHFFQRLRQHRQKPWWNQVELIGLRQYTNSAEMDLAEIYWIQQKSPPYNTDNNHQGNYHYLQIQDQSDEFLFHQNEFLDRAKQYYQSHGTASFSSSVQEFCNDFDIDFCTNPNESR